MREEDSFLNKSCKLVKNDGFILHGLVKAINDNGVFFQTDQKTSFINWCNIREIVPEEA